MGIPPFAGFWSKDEIIATAWHTHHYPIYVVAVVTAFLTALYMTRAVLLTFFGTYRGEAHPHESPSAMTNPMLVLAALSVGAGFLNTPFLHPFRDWIGEPFGPVTHEPYSFALAGVSVIAAGVGIAIGFGLYSTYRARDPITRLGPAYTLLVNKYYLDDLYLKGVVRPIAYPIASAVYWTNQHILDGGVNGVAWLTRKIAGGVNWNDQHVIDGAVNGLGRFTRGSGGLLRYLQTGRVQWYAAFLFLGVGVMAVIFVAIH